MRSRPPRTAGRRSTGPTTRISSLTTKPLASSPMFQVRPHSLRFGVFVMVRKQVLGIHGRAEHSFGLASDITVNTPEGVP
jgi:hypothetical protein